MVLVLGDEGEDKYLVAYIVLESSDTSKKDVRAALKTRLRIIMKCSCNHHGSVGARCADVQRVLYFVVASMDISLRAFWRSMRFTERWKTARVLLTGATGFLGAFILRDLLLNTEVLPT